MNEECIEQARTFCSFSLSLSPSLSLTGKQGAPLTNSPVRERERVRERKRGRERERVRKSDIGRERKSEREGERERERDVEYGY